MTRLRASSAAGFAFTVGLATTALGVGCAGEDRDTPTTGPGSSAGALMSGPSGTTTGVGGGGVGGGGVGGGGVGGGETGWETLASLDAPLQENGVVVLGAEVVVIGGYDNATIVDRVEAYDPAADSWRSLASLPSERHHVNAETVDGKIYVVGGLVGNGFNATGESNVYDPASNSWSTVASMPAGTERGGAATGVIGSTLYVAGGYRSGSVADFSAYDTSSDSWATLPPLPAPRDHLVGGAVNGVFYVVGGRSGGINGVLPAVDIYDPETGAWASGAPMITARAGCAAAVFGSQLFVFGGEGNVATASGVFADVEAYDTATDTWSTHPDMLTPRHGTGAGTIGDVIYVPGGADTQAFGAVAVHEAYRP